MNGFLSVRLQAIWGNQRLADGTNHKTQLRGRVFLATQGLEAENGIQEYFSDPDCALMHYALEHYDFWRERYPMLTAQALYTGLFGENFSTRGMTENNICLGDIFRLGSAEIQVSWGRVACQTMAARLQDPKAPDIMHQQSRNGWFYRVVVPGEICCDDSFILIDRPAESWTLSRTQGIIFNHLGSDEELQALSEMPFLAKPWRTEAMLRLKNSHI